MVSKEILSFMSNNMKDIPKLLEIISDANGVTSLILYIKSAEDTHWNYYYGNIPKRDVELKTDLFRFSIGEKGLLFSDKELCIVPAVENLLNILIENHLKRNDYQDLFMANMSHEIRTPLNGIIGYNQLLTRTQLNSTQQSYLANMKQCSIQLMQIINDILDFFKLSSGKIIKENESFRPKEIVKAVKGALNHCLQNKKQNFMFFIDKKVPEFIVMDKKKIIQVVMNLVTNAHKFTPISGEIILSMDIEQGYFVINVSDNGIGIAKEYHAKIFQPFEQVNGTGIGTGLGLAICKKIINHLYGTIKVDSKLGEGSRFTITAPFKTYENFATEIQKDVTLLRNKKILVVDDNIDNRILLSEMLFEWEMEPVICASALEALRMVQSKRIDGSLRHNFDLGLIDICMPITTGTELAVQIKNELPLLPMLALSSLDNFIITPDFVDVLEKPLDKIQLLTYISRIFSSIKNPPAFIGKENITHPKPSIPAIKFNKNIKILLAEDVSYNSDLVVTMLKNLGYSNITTSKNGSEAIEKLQTAQLTGSPYEILLLDLRMPIKNGYDVILEYQKRKWTLPKIIVLTASIMDKDRKKCQNLNVKYFLNKPIEFTQLEQVMLYVSNKVNP